MAVGQFTFCEALKLSNLSSIKKSTILPYFNLATSFTLFIGLIRVSAAGLKILARWQAGPDPIDLPLTRMSLSANLQVSLKNRYTVSASFKICYALCYVLSDFELCGQRPQPGYSMHIMLILKNLTILFIKGQVKEMSSPLA